MLNSIRPYSEPVDDIKTLLGSSFEKEYSALSLLCGLLQMNHPKKIVKAGGANNSVTAAVLCCIDKLQLPCQLYITESCGEILPCVKDDFDLEEELERRHSENFHNLKENTLASCMDEIGDGVDLMILDVAEVMPYDLLDFIAAFPYLAPNAIVVICGTLSGHFPKNVLYQSITADKFSMHFPTCFDLQDCIKLITTETISAFQINGNTAQHIPDLFAVLNYPWSSTPTLGHLLEYEAFVKKHYDPLCVRLYEEAILAADPYKEMLTAMAQSLAGSFSQVLLYGKGRRGSYFLKLARLLNLPVTGFVVSDGRNPEKTYENLPVYSFSAIPFPSSEVFIIQTAASTEIELCLRKSRYHWMRLPDAFWDDFEYEYYHQYYMQDTKIQSDFTNGKAWAWNKGKFGLGTEER